MSNTNIDWTAMTGPLTELHKINQKASEEIIRASISFGSDFVGTSMKYVPKANNPEDFYSAQLKILAQQGEKVLEYTQNIFQIYQSAIKEQLAWAEEECGHALKNVVPKHGKKGSETA